jgi:hypothetical protein
VPSLPHSLTPNRLACLADLRHLVATKRASQRRVSTNYVVQPYPRANASNPNAQLKYEYLQLEEIEGIRLLRGWYQRVTSAAVVRAGKLSLSLLEGSKAVASPGFVTAVELQTLPSGEWHTVWRRGSNESCPSTCNRTIPTLESCSVVCVAGKLNTDGKVLQSSAEMSLVSSGTTMVRATLQTAEDTGGNRGVCVSGAASVAMTAAGASGEGSAPAAVASVAWDLWIGIDPLESSAQEEMIVNATHTIKGCTCSGVG